MGIYQGNYSIIPEVKSAYTQAVAGGYAGTEEDFNQLLSSIGGFPLSIDSNEKIRRGNNRKLLAMIGSLNDLKSDFKTQTSNRISAINQEKSWVDIFIAGRTVRLNLDNPENGSPYEILYLSGYGFNRNSVYSCKKESAKTIIDINVDNQRFTDLSFLTEGFTFHHLTINYEVDEIAENGTTHNQILTTLSITPDKICICESGANASGNLVKTLININSGDNVNTIAAHGNNLKVFTIKPSGSRYYIERVDSPADNVVIKTFNLEGGF